MAEAARHGRNAYELLIEKGGDNPSNLLVLPYFTPTRTPYFDTEARGAILGLQLSTKKCEIIRALLEGLALEMRLNLDILEESGYKVNELRVIGGGAKSDIWNQLKADVLGKKITVLNITEAGCQGVAMLARAAHSQVSPIEITGKWVKPISYKNPRGNYKIIYDRKFCEYKEIYPTLRKLRSQVREEK